MDGIYRFRVYFRRLNAATIPDRYPLPRMDDFIERLSTAKVFSLLEALLGYWKVPFADEHYDKASFKIHVCIYRYFHMPFGLIIAPSSFPRALNIILPDVRWRMCLVYINGIIIFSKNYEEHLENLSTVVYLLEGARKNSN